MSNFGAYWLGAIVGLIFAAALTATLSVVSPLPGEKPMEVAMAPEVKVEPASEPVTTEAPASEPEPEPELQPAPEPQATVQPEPQLEQTQAPVTPEPAMPIVTAEVQPEIAPAPEAEPEPEPEATVEAEPEPEPQPAETETAPEPAAPAAPTINALRDNSERYRGDESQPLLSIVLIGLGDPALNIDEIFLLPAPLTVVVDAKADNAEALIADARDAGFEALVAVDQAVIENLEALLEDVGPVIGAAALEDQVSSQAAISVLTSGLAGRGMGLFDASSGAAYRAAQAADLPAAPGGRRFDENQNSEAVYQALERAAFDARRAGAFVVYARPDPAIMTGLRRWMSLKANRSVAVSPLSTVMRKLGRQ